MIGVKGLVRRFVGIAMAGVMLAIVAAAPAAALDFPALTGRVVDQANILDASARSALTEKLAALETKTTTQLVVVTLKSLQGTTIEDFGVQLGRHWQIGQKGKNNGALLIVAPNERKVRVEVGYGLEGTLTDAIAKVIIENAILPRFKAGDMPDGIRRGVDDLILVLQSEGEAFKQQAAAQQQGPRQDQQDIAVTLLVLFFVGMAFYTVFLVIRDMFRGAKDAKRRGRSVWSTLATAASSGSSWGSSWGSSSSSDGGFSGGGGSFGGGGSSGSW